MNYDDYRKKLQDARFAPITDEVFDLYKQFEKKCKEDNNSAGLAELSFYKGEAYFRLGKYEETLQCLTQGLICEDSDTPPKLIANIHNILGLMYVSLGYEMTAMEHYLLSIDYSKKTGDFRSKAVTEINLGWMYRDLGDYNTALEYFYNSLSDTEMHNVVGAYNLRELCLAYIGQVNFLMGNYEEGVRIMQMLEKEDVEKQKIFYEVVAQNLFIRGYKYLNNREKLEQTIDFAIENAMQQEDFLEFSEAYFDICRFLITFDRERSKKMMDVICDHCNKTNIPFLQLKLKVLNIAYAEKYLGHSEYLKECEEYYRIRKEYDTYHRKYIVKSLSSIKALQRERKRRAYYQEQTRYDQMTGLLNKVSFSTGVKKLINAIDFDKQQCALAILDIDNFKHINDSLGHSAGDDEIVSLSSQMSESFSTGTVLGRVGGDEFAVFWPEVTEEKLIIMQLEEFCRNYSKGGCSLSAGLACSDGKTEFEELFKSADEALYKAKDNGKDQVVEYKKGCNTTAASE